MVFFRVLICGLVLLSATGFGSHLVSNNNQEPLSDRNGFPKHPVVDGIQGNLQYATTEIPLHLGPIEAWTDAQGTLYATNQTGQFIVNGRYLAKDVQVSRNIIAYILDGRLYAVNSSGTVILSSVQGVTHFHVHNHFLTYTLVSGPTISINYWGQRQ